MTLLVAAMAGGVTAWCAWKMFDARLGHQRMRVRAVEVFVPMGLGCAICSCGALALRVPYAKVILWP